MPELGVCRAGSPEGRWTRSTDRGDPCAGSRCLLHGEMAPSHKHKAPLAQESEKLTQDTGQAATPPDGAGEPMNARVSELQKPQPTLPKLLSMRTMQPLLPQLCSPKHVTKCPLGPTFIKNAWGRETGRHSPASSARDKATMRLTNELHVANWKVAHTRCCLNLFRQLALLSPSTTDSVTYNNRNRFSHSTGG